MIQWKYCHLTPTTSKKDKTQYVAFLHLKKTKLLFLLLHVHVGKTDNFIESTVPTVQQVLLLFHQPNNFGMQRNNGGKMLFISFGRNDIKA